MKLGRVSIFFFLAKMDFFILLCINICYFVIGIKPKKKKNLKWKRKKKGSDIGSTWDVKPVSGAITSWLSLHLFKPQILYLLRSLK